MGIRTGAGWPDVLEAGRWSWLGSGLREESLCRTLFLALVGGWVQPKYVVNLNM